MSEEKHEIRVISMKYTLIDFNLLKITSSTAIIGHTFLNALLNAIDYNEKCEGDTEWN